jgi:hypothetical protein
MNIPADFELVGFFETEPILRIPGTPWEYNGLTFNAVRDNHRVQCHIETDVGAVTLRWSEGAIQRADVTLKWVGSLTIGRIQGIEVLVATQVSGNPDLTVELRLRPEVSIKLIAQPKFP